MTSRAVQLELIAAAAPPAPPATRRGVAHAWARGARGREKERTFVPHHGRHDMLRGILERQVRDRRYRREFQVVHYSIQSNHLHLIVEADDARAMRSGVSGLVIAFAKRLNKLLDRLKGKVWSDRYHSRDLTTPTAVRRALVYVLQNVRKHGFELLGAWLDPLSTAHCFDGWITPLGVGDETPPIHERFWSALSTAESAPASSRTPPALPTTSRRRSLRSFPP